MSHIITEYILDINKNYALFHIICTLLVGIYMFLLDMIAQKLVCKEIGVKALRTAIFV